jgi:antitoxin ChpS
MTDNERTKPKYTLRQLMIESGWEVDDMPEEPVKRPGARPKYRLEDLLRECDPTAPISAEEQEWLDSPPVGREII